jgi:bifunctional ADP-heptose synthase (sugar kinase/adenylyltransferase)
MPIITTNLETVLSDKVAAASSTTENKDLLLLSKSIEALDNTIRLTPADIGVTVQGYNAEIATNASVATAVAGIVDSAPATLDTLNELAAALGDDANFAATTTAAIGNKVNTASPTFTGTLDGAGNDYTNLHAEVTGRTAATNETIDFTKPYHDINLTGAVTFTTSNRQKGRMMIAAIYQASSVSIAFGSEVKWPDDTEPTWGDSNYWVVSLTALNTAAVAASAQGYTV